MDADDDRQSSVSWAVPCMDAQNIAATFVDKLQTELTELAKLHGGPLQYLERAMPEVSHNNAFAAWLWDTFPEQDDTLYHHSAVLPAIGDDDLAQTPPLCLHLASLGIQGICSLKPAPGRELCVQLLEQYLVDGFTTSGDALLVTQPEELLMRWDA